MKKRAEFLSTSLQAVILCGGIFGTSDCRSCTDKSETSAAPKGLKAIPVVLTIATLQSDVRLPCHYCDESVGISGRVWRRRDLNGDEEEVQLDMHDDDTKNRVFVDKEHNLIIRDITDNDGAYYFCYDIENITSPSAMKMDILLDVGYRSTLEPNVLELPLDVDKEVPKLMKSCEKITSISSLSMYSCYAEWSPWSKCDVCGKIGTRKRVGECRLQKFAKAEIKTPEGKTVEADFPIVGIGCHSVLLNAIPAAKKILNQIPNIVLQEKCEVSCDNYVVTATEMVAYKKSSFLKKIKVRTLKKKGAKQTLTSVMKEEYEGASLTFFCPGASLDTRVKWKLHNRPLRPDKVKEKTSGRMTIDATDALHIKDLRVTDSGEYICSMYEVEIGLVRLRVLSTYTAFDPTSNFGILTIAMVFSFVLWMILMAIKWKSFKLQQEVQKKRAQRKKIYKNSNELESQQLLMED